jgi:N-acetylglucosaminyl-diphospho-decaprenol L-rhamnosyltransferase
MSADRPQLPAPRVSAVVVSHNTRTELLRCLAALHASSAPPLETIVVDNASSDGTPDAVREAFPQVVVVASPANLGFSRANNLAIARARGPYVLVVNPDAELRPSALEALLLRLDSRPDVALVGPRTVSPDGTVQVSFGPDLQLVSEWRQRRLVRGVKRRDPGALRRAGVGASVEHEPDWVSGSCFLARRQVLLDIGAFDERYFLYEEDADLCLRLRQAGHKVLFTPSGEVVHHLGASMDRARELARFEYHRSHLIYYDKHNGVASRLALRSLLALRAASSWVASLGAAEGSAKRRRASSLLALSFAPLEER